MFFPHLAMLITQPLPTLNVSVDEKSGSYEVDLPQEQLRFLGETPGPISELSIRPLQRSDGDKEANFLCQGAEPARYTIRWNPHGQNVLFRVHYLTTTPGDGIVFPNFTTFPTGFQHYSFEDSAFAPPSFGRLHETSTPWLFFNNSAQAFILSPASNFLVAKMTGDGLLTLGVGLNKRLNEVPAGLDSDSILAFGNGIGRTWDAWGAALRKLYGRAQTNYTADILLQKFGYWTDNGADYYYNYDPTLGYAKTLVALKQRYDEEKIPISYLQLDSWWYSKTINDPAGRPGGLSKNPKLPLGEWNRYGGLMEYRAHPALFPEGLASFDKEVGVPLAVHNRWIDAISPYHQKYAISGVGAVDPRWWSDIVAYLKKSGVTTYEQDWLVDIYAHSPEMARKVGVADAFADGMADACRKAGLTMQYCMATPRFFLQGVKYPNLTTIRTSGDRFEPRKWRHFLYVSQLADACGIAPWCDVFKSSETGNLILSVLSAGPVGTGDAMGKEDIPNLQRVFRTDGVIVKPDRAILPIDRTYIDDAIGSKDPFVAKTYTVQSGYRTSYFFAFPRKDGTSIANVAPRDLDSNGDQYMLDLVTGEGRLLKSGKGIELACGSAGFAYAMLAQIGPSGIAILGDLDKFVPTGSQRIRKLVGERLGVHVTVAFAKSEARVTLSGYAQMRPTVRATKGSVGKVTWHPDSKRFEVVVSPPAPGADAQITVSP